MTWIVDPAQGLDIAVTAPVSAAASKTAIPEVSHGCWHGPRPRPGLCLLQIEQ